MLSLPQSCSELEAGREAEVLLVAELAGGRTILRRQYVGYPFHITRPFQLDRMRPDLATLYLQSTSGGLYAADRLALDLTIGAGAALNLTTQASTVVHDGREEGSRMRHVGRRCRIGLFVRSSPILTFFFRAPICTSRQQRPSPPMES